MTHKFAVIGYGLMIVLGMSVSGCHSDGSEKQSEPATKQTDNNSTNKLEKPPVDLNSVSESQRVPDMDKVPDELRPPTS